MTRSSDEIGLEASIRLAFEALARDLGADASLLRVRVAPIDAEARFEHAEEALVVASAVDARRREFATARRLAHEILLEFGHASAPLLPGLRRAPAWPAGVIGSISHAHGVAAVVIAARPPFSGVGLDVEAADPLRPELVDTVLTAREKFELARAGADLGAAAKLAFAAKECAYKAWSPTLTVVPEFHDVEVDFDRARASFVAHWKPRAGPRLDERRLHGRCAQHGARVFAAALAREPHP